MGTYVYDRDFTEYVHKNLAIPLIYRRLNWEVQTINNNVITNVDISNAVDRFLIDVNNRKIITTQERFRDEKYSNFSDFTIRYKRDFKKDELNIAWVTDVSEFRFNRKRLYLSVIQDLYNGQFKAYQISRSQNQDLILRTLKKAINPNEDL